MKKAFLGLLIISTLIISGCSWNKKPAQQSIIKPSTAGTGKLNQEQVDAMEKDKQMQQDAMKKKANEVMIQKNPPIYKSYNELTAKSLAKAGKKIVLFFYSPSCVTCNTVDSELTSKITTFPDNTVILKVDYDSATELKSIYNVTAAHTLILIDKDMNTVKKSTGGDINTIIKLAQ